MFSVSMCMNKWEVESSKESLHWCFPTIGNALLEDDKVFHLVRPADELDETKSKRGSIKDKSMTKAITEIYLTRLLSVKVQDKNIYAIITVSRALLHWLNSKILLYKPRFFQVKAILERAENAQ